MKKLSQTRAGFTLLEMLVVIGILAMLLAILLPAVNNVQKNAQQAVCASNMSNLYKGLAALRSQTTGKDVANSTFSGAGDVEMFMMSSWPAQLHNRADYADTRIFKCPLDEGTNTAQDVTLFNLAIKVYGSDHKTYLGYCLPLVEGAMCVKKNVTDTSYELWMEDIMGGGDRDYNDLIVKVTSLGNGNYSLNLTKGSAGYRFDLIDTETNVTLATNFSSYTPQQKYAPTPTSYGVSWGQNPPRCDRNLGRAGKLYMIEYISAVVDADFDDWRKQPFMGLDGVHRFARHQGKMNAMYGDGHIESVLPAQIAPMDDNIRKVLWNP